MTIKYYKEVTDMKGTWIKPAPEIAEKLKQLTAEIKRLTALLKK